MTRRRISYIDSNLPQVIKYCEENDFEYESFNNGNHLKIAGSAAMIDLWPGRMVYHVIRAEYPLPAETYTRPKNLRFDKKLMDKLLKGK